MTIRNNLFVISKKDYGGTGYFLLIGSAPRNIKFDHNTIVHDGTALVYAYTGTYIGADGATHTDGTINGFECTNNVSVNGQYGFNSYGSMNGANLLNAFPGIVMQGNVLGGLYRQGRTRRTTITRSCRIHDVLRELSPGRTTTS